MSSSFVTHIRIPEVDPRNPESIVRMWVVFSKCSGLVEEGERLKNIAWRLWNRGRSYCQSPQDLATTRTTEANARLPSLSKVPSLPNSVDSAASEDTKSARPVENPQPSGGRTKEHLTPGGVERIILAITTTTDLKPLGPKVAAKVADPTSSFTLCHSYGDSNIPPLKAHLQNSSSSLTEFTKIIRGFSPPHLQKSNSGQKLTALPQLRQMSQPKTPDKDGMFTLGSSTNDDEGQFGKTSSLFKNPTFKEMVQNRRSNVDTDDEGAIESDTEASERAVDDGAWEDSDSGGGPASQVDENIFKRVDSQALLTTRPSMLTIQLRKPPRPAVLAKKASRGHPASRRKGAPPRGTPGPSLFDEPTLTTPDPQSSRPLPIASRPNSHRPADSTPTTQRKMIATELTKLRKCLRWERQQKREVNAALEHQHTTENITDLLDWDDGGPWYYHTKGW